MTTLKTRCHDFMQALGTPVTRFCRMIQLSPSAYYQWQHDELILSEATLGRIEQLLNRFGF